TEVVALRQNRSRPTGLAALRVTTTDQQDRLVLDFWRCAMLPLRDPGVDTGKREDLDAVGRPPQSEVVAGLVDGFDLTAFPAGGQQVLPGDVWHVESGDVVSSAPELARLTLNVAAVHHDEFAGGSGRLVYGGTPSASRCRKSTARCRTWWRSPGGMVATTSARCGKGTPSTAASRRRRSNSCRVEGCWCTWEFGCAPDPRAILPSGRCSTGARSSCWRAAGPDGRTRWGAQGVGRLEVSRSSRRDGGKSATSAARHVCAGWSRRVVAQLGADAFGCFQQLRQHFLAHLLRGGSSSRCGRCDRGDDLTVVVAHWRGERDESFFAFVDRHGPSLFAHNGEDFAEFLRIGDGVGGEAGQSVLVDHLLDAFRWFPSQQHSPQ